jgi:hypothetical protein
MEATKEQIMTTAAILLAGGISGEQSSALYSRLTISGPRYVKDAVKLAKMIASEVYGE